MGNYMGLRVKVTVKEEFRPMIQAINEGVEWVKYAGEFPFLADFAKQSKSRHIPRGNVICMPSSWESSRKTEFR